MDNLETLSVIRLHLSTIGASPAEWQALGEAYRRIGALSNAAACQRRAGSAGQIQAPLQAEPVRVEIPVHA